MTGVHLHIDRGAAETRYFWTRDGEIIGFWFAPIEDRYAQTANVGDVFLGRVRRVAKALDGAFVDLGVGTDGFISARRAQRKLSEGMALPVRVRRPAIGTKGPDLDGDWRAGLQDSQIEGVLSWIGDELAAPQRAPLWLDPATDIFRVLSPREMSKISVYPASDVELLRGFLSGTLHCEINAAADALWTDEIERELEASLGRRCPLLGGGEVTFDETEAGVMIDVDTGGASEGGGSRLNDRVNLAAAKVIRREIVRRGLGGLIVVDFLPVSSTSAQQELIAKFGKIGRGGRLDKDGVFTVRQPRRRLSLLETIRRDKLGWQARKAIRQLEIRLAQNRSGAFSLILEASRFRYLEDRPQWRERLQARFGARFDFRASAQKDDVTEQGYDIIEKA